MYKLGILVFGITCFLCNLLNANPLGVIAYQGRVDEDGTLPTGIKKFKFAISNSLGSTTYWSQDGTSTAGSEPTGSVDLYVDQGLFTILLGETSVSGQTESLITAAPYASSDILFLRVWYSSDGTTFERLAPDVRITGSMYALRALTADRLGDSATVDAAQITLGDSGLALGTGTSASGQAAIAIGEKNDASGDLSAAFGLGTDSSYLQLVAGRYNEPLGDAVSWVEADPLFVLGNGADDANRNNALVVAKNGDTAIDGDLRLSGALRHWGDRNVEIGREAYEDREFIINISGDGGSVFRIEGPAVLFSSVSIEQTFTSPYEGYLTQIDFPRALAVYRFASHSLNIFELQPNGDPFLPAIYDSNPHTDTGSIDGLDLSSNPPALKAGTKYKIVFTSSVNPSFIAEPFIEIWQYDSDVYAEGESGGNPDSDYDFEMDIRIHRSPNRGLVVDQTTGHVAIGGLPGSPSEMLHVNGNILAEGTVTTSSDLNLKSEIAPLGNVLEDVMQLTPSSYQLKHHDSERRRFGFIAQDVAEYFPDTVFDGGQHLSLAYDDFGVLAIKAIQEQQLMIDSLQETIAKDEAQIKALQEQNTLLIERLEALEVEVGVTPQ
ncbi:tail fiber domain-containing protein [Rubellicoccus peritrichatus]|uniref:Tail fiber domain-containing protein n=1 Tax=Rubellicoccus peritrichatus TaxID=3080537 RepID=A0AAQ3L8K6_9BACT|nr:tail fiber domain-containing protein [Puniceicoccus sp. CR14]WOO39909.1 tail fiber domain-containing protein [Puniceicoccus sp. CR14]